MEVSMTDEELRDFARKGAEIRLKEIRGEEEKIYSIFPDLRASGKAVRLAVPTAKELKKTAPVRRRWKMSAKARKDVSRRMRKYWAERRRAQKN